jgi:cytochrome P450
VTIINDELQTILSVNPWVIHRNPEVFGEDCDNFNPDRWLQEDTSQINAFLIHVCIRFLPHHLAKLLY